MNSMLLVGIVVTGIALLFCIISTAIPYWWLSETENIGLFRFCMKLRIMRVESCGDTGGADWVKATRAMMILSIMALGASLLLSIIFGFLMKDKPILALGSAGMCFASAGLTLLGVIIYGAKAPGVYGQLRGSLHAGFGLAIITGIAAVVAGVFIVLARNRNE